MLIILRALFVASAIGAGIYVLIYLATMTRYFDKARQKRILRRTLFGLVSVLLTAFILGAIITILN